MAKRCFTYWITSALWILTASMVICDRQEFSRCTGNVISLQLYQHISRTAKLAAISYCVGREGIQKPFNCLNRCSHFPEMTLAQTWDTGIFYNSCGFIAYSDDQHPNITAPQILVVFRGTSSFTNIMSDLEATHADYTPLPTDGRDRCVNCTVHRGFVAAWNATRDLIQPQLHVLRKIHPNHRFVLVGHSLGGAVAGLAGLEMQNTGDWGDIEVVTFGEPRWGNRETAAFVDKSFGCDAREANSEGCQYRRVVNRGDPVPDLPPADWGWTAHGGEIMIMQGGLAPQREDVSFCRSHDLSLAAGKSTTIVDAEIPSLWRSDSLVRPRASQGLSVQRPLNPASEASWPLDFPHREYFVGMGICFDANWGQGFWST